MADWVRDTPRLAAALSQATESQCGPGDLAVLVRDALRYWQELHSSIALPAPLSVPAVAPWPDHPTWRMCGVSVAPGYDADKCRITAVAPWMPTWARSDRTESLDGFAAGRSMRRIVD